MKETVIAAAMMFALLIPANAAAAATEIGPCADEDAIRIQVGTYATVCVHAVDSNECDANDIVVRVGGRTLCVRIP